MKRDFSQPLLRDKDNRKYLMPGGQGAQEKGIDEKIEDIKIGINRSINKVYD